MVNIVELFEDLAINIYRILPKATVIHDWVISQLWCHFALAVPKLTISPKF